MDVHTVLWCSFIVVVVFVDLTRRGIGRRRAGARKRAWFEALEAALAARGLDAAVIVDVTPMKLRVRLSGPAAAAFPGPLAREDAFERLRSHGLIVVEGGELVASLRRDLVDLWGPGAADRYADEVRALIDALERRAHRPPVPPPAVAGAVEADAVARDASTQEATGAPSGAPVAVPRDE